MDNLEAAALLNEMADALEYLDEPFRARAYRKAGIAMAGLELPVGTLIADGTLKDIPGIGKGILATLTSWEHGDFSGLNEVVGRLPSGFSEIIKVPGLGLKRIRELKLMGIETLEDLKLALDGGRLSSFKGLTARFESRMRRAIADIIEGRGRILLNRAFDIARSLEEIFRSNQIDAVMTGELRRTGETISSIDFLVSEENDAVARLKSIFGDKLVKAGDILTVNVRNAPVVKIRLSGRNARCISLFLTTGSNRHIDNLKGYINARGYEINDGGLFKEGLAVFPETEEDIYRIAGLSYIPCEAREGFNEIEFAADKAFPRLIDNRDIIGTIHNHTTYSDGKASLSEMAMSAQNAGYEWIGISDHSISAHYAGGMSIKSLQRQHAEIDVLNEKTGIRILKGIECDIGQDGSLDYGHDVLKTFDYVIASIHTHMDMEKAAMTQRIITAVRNPLTSMLAHPTGRLLLARSPYEVDMDAVLEECLACRVIVEINANPMRLDLDWRRAGEFVAAGGMLAISPDAHEISGLADMRFGVMMARKALVTSGSCINTLGAKDALYCLRRSR